MSSKLQEIKLTQKELDNLPDYSISLPTGKTTGKQWKRKHGNGWIMGEYGKIDGDDILIHWKSIKIITDDESLILSRLYS